MAEKTWDPDFGPSYTPPLKHPANYDDKIGNRYTRLFVIERDYNVKRESGTYWKCLCDCGNVVSVSGHNLKKGLTKSCGCLHKEIVAIKNSTHRSCKTKEYRAWRAMITRCYNPNHRAYSWYGGKGIKVHTRWKGSFENFLSDLGHAPTTKHTLDRIDSTKDYEPGNCRWATMNEQQNNRCSNLRFNFRGRAVTPAELAREFNFPYQTILNRLNSGMDAETAISKKHMQKLEEGVVT